MSPVGSGCGQGAVAGNSGWEGEVESAEFNFAGKGRVGGDGGVAVIDLRLSVENVVQAAHGGGATLKNVGHPAEGDHGPDEQAEVAIEGDQGAERDLATKQLVPALPQNNQERNADKRLERGHEHAPGADELDVA